MAHTETRPFWDAQFDMREAISDYAAWQDRHEALSAEADRHGAMQRVPVGGEAVALLTLAGARRTRAVVFVNGVNWQVLQSSAFSFVAETAVAARATFSVVEYRTLPEARMADAVEDVVAAIDAALALCERTVVVGYCGGAHLVAEAAIRSARTPVATVAISGIYDLDPLRQSEIGERLEITRDEAREFSPLRRASLLHTPLHLVVGADETTEHRRQSVRMFEAAREAGKPATLTFVPRRHHASVVTDLADTRSGVSRLVQRLLE